jgi:hypothetical protein
MPEKITKIFTGVATPPCQQQQQQRCIDRYTEKNEGSYQKHPDVLHTK